MAASALMRPSSEFRVATTGLSWPVGHRVRYPSGPCGTTETFSEYAAAVSGMLQPPSCGMGKLREVPPGIGPPVNRVSIRRQGVAATNCCAWEKMASIVKDCVIVTVQEPVPRRSEEHTSE